MAVHVEEPLHAKVNQHQTQVQSYVRERPRYYLHAPVTKPSNNRGIYDWSKRRSQVTLIYSVKVKGLDGWNDKTSDLNMGDSCCLFQADSQKWLPNNNFNQTIMFP